MTPNKIAILYTTFLRDELMYKTVQSIIDNWTSQYALFIADQGRITKEKSKFYHTLKANNPNVFIYQLPFDCGLSYARNFLVKEIMKKKISYIFLTADSIYFKKQYNFDKIIKFLNIDKNYGIVGLKLDNRQSWEKDLDLKPGKDFILSNPSRNPIIFENQKFQPVDICKNYFLAKTQTLTDCPWDNQFKLAEHEDFAWRLKTTTPYKTFYTDDIPAFYSRERTGEYQYFRHRLYKEFIQKLREKYNITGWTQCI